MKIINDNRNFIKIADIRTGDVFQDKLGNVCIRTGGLDNFQTREYAAIDLKLGEDMFYGAVDEATLLDAALIIKGELRAPTK